MPVRQAHPHAQSATLSQPTHTQPTHDVASSVDFSRAHVHGHAHVRGHKLGGARGLHGERLVGHAHLHDVGQPANGAPVSSRAERAATWLSLACAVHCLLMPIAVSVMPLLGASGLTNLGSTAEAVLTLLVVASALAGGVWGYRRHHDPRVVYATGVGLVVYLVGHAPGHAFGEALAHSWYGMALAVLGALILAGSSFLSARLSHACASAACTH